jgi:hypothetical protein
MSRYSIVVTLHGERQFTKESDMMTSKQTAASKERCQTLRPDALTGRSAEVELTVLTEEVLKNVFGGSATAGGKWQ